MVLGLLECGVANSRGYENSSRISYLRFWDETAGADSTFTNCHGGWVASFVLFIFDVPVIKFDNYKKAYTVCFF